MTALRFPWRPLVAVVLAGIWRGALVDLGRRVAIVTIGYHGNDSCWEGPDEETVVAW